MKSRNRDSTLILDAGDHFTGSPYFAHFQGMCEIEMLEMLGYQASALGNHDFDAKIEGEKALPRFKSLAKKYAPNVTMMCANVLNKER